MDNKTYFIYLLLMAGSTYLIRSIPFALFKKKIENPWIQAFLTYIPYAVLTAMTIPAIFYATDSTFSATVGLIVAILAAFLGKDLTTVAIAACVAVFLAESIPL